MAFFRMQGLGTYAGLGTCAGSGTFYQVPDAKCFIGFRRISRKSQDFRANLGNSKGSLEFLRKSWILNEILEFSI